MVINAPLNYIPLHLAPLIPHYTYKMTTAPCLQEPSLIEIRTELPSTDSHSPQQAQKPIGLEQVLLLQWLLKHQKQLQWPLQGQ